MRLPRPLPDLRQRESSTEQELEETTFVVCRASPDSDHAADPDATGRLLYDPTTPRALLDRLSGSNPRSTGAAFTTTFAHAKTALAVGAIGLLALLTVACGSEEASPEPAEERPATQTTDRTDPEPSGSAARNVPTDTATPTNSSQSANAGSTESGGSSTPRQGSTAEPTGAPTTSAASEQSGPAEQPAPTGEQLKQAEVLYLEAELYLLNQRFHRASHSLDQAIAINPNLAEAYTLRGFTHTMLRDHDGAMQDFDKALAMGAENAGRAHAFRSYAHSEMGNYEDALADAETAREMIHHEDQFARADADLAQFTALYRSGDYATIDTYSLQRLPQGSTRDLNQNLAPYGLVKLYEHLDVHRNIDTILEADTHLLLNPDDVNFLRNRYIAHRDLRWHKKALEDLSKITELTEEDRRASLYVQRARIWAQIGDYEAIVQHAADLEPSRDIEAGALLAIAYWNLGDVQKATDSINAFDYSDPTALFYWDENYPPTNANDLNSSYSSDITAHLAIKGALLAVQERLEEGLKYLNIPACNDRIIAAADDVPITWHAGYSSEQPLHIIASQLADPWFNAKRYEHQWAEMSHAKAMWEWCDYPAELATDPEAGMWTTMALPSHVSQPNPPFPTRVSYNSRVSHPNFFDPIVISSDDPDLRLYMAAWAQFGLPYSSAIDMLRDIDQAIELGADNPNTHRIKAETHLAWALRRNPIHRPDSEERQAWTEHHYDQAVDAYATYESLASPLRWEAARYHFARGKVLGRLEMKQEAQSAYQQAFQHGFSEDAVKQALMELNR